MNSLGEFYEKGYIVNKDLKKSINWYSKASELSYKTGETNLIRFYEQGIQIECILKKAV